LKDEFGIGENKRNAIVAQAAERWPLIYDTPIFYAKVYRAVKANPGEFGGAVAAG
jgi:hypothetical protein